MSESNKKQPTLFKHVPYVTLGSKSKINDYPQGAYTASYNVNGEQKSGKTAAIHINGDDVAYEIAEDWAARKAVEMGCEFREIPKKVLDSRIRSNSSYRSNQEPHSWDEFNNKKFAHKLINDGIKKYGVTAVKERLHYFIEYFDEVAAEAIKAEKIIVEANTLLAKAMVDVFEKTGIDMLNSIQDDSVRAIYQELLTS